VATVKDKLTGVYAHTTHRAADELASAIFIQIRGGQVSPLRAAGEAHLWNQWHGPLLSSFSCRTALAQTDYITLHRWNSNLEVGSHKSSFNYQLMN